MKKDKSEKSNIQIDSMIFIIGVGRSGTTLIQSMLNAHSNIVFPPETHFIRNHLAKRRYAKISYSQKLIQDESLKKLGFNLNGLIELSMSNNKIDLLSLYQQILTKYARKYDGKILGDKDPKNIEYIEVIKKYFPNARIVHIIRDPRDTVLSRLKAQWSRGRSVTLHALTYQYQITKGRNDLIKLFNNSYFEIIYKDLILNPEKTLKKLSVFLNIYYETDMLSYYKFSKNIIKGNEINWKKNNFVPIIKSNIDKWKKDLDLNDIVKIEFICKETFTLIHEPIYTRNLNPLLKLYFSTIRFLFNYAYSMYLKIV